MTAHSFNRYFINTHCVPGTVLDRAGKETGQALVSGGSKAGLAYRQEVGTCALKGRGGTTGQRDGECGE